MLNKIAARKIARRLYPKSNVLSIKQFKKGVINKPYLVNLKNPNKEIVIRIYPDEEWKARKEEYIFNLMEKKKIPVPKVLHVDTTKKIIPNTYTILSKVEGQELGVIYKKTKNKELIKKAGEYLAKIHSIKFRNFGWIIEDRIEPEFKKWRDYVYYELYHKISALSDVKGISKNFVVKAFDYFDQRRHLLNIKTRPCLLHKDYHFSHLLADSNKINGIIDVEWAIAGHNELDVIKSEWWMFEDHPETRKIFFDGYKRFGSISNNYTKRKSIYELLLSLGLISLSYKLKNKHWLNYNISKAREILNGKHN